MEDYNALISAKILDGYEGMIDKVPQPQMLGGKRMRNFVLPGSTEYDYPGTLSVGTMNGKPASNLGGAFFKDFNKGFPMGEDLEGGASHCEGGVVIPAGNPRRVGGFNIGKALKSVGKALNPKKIVKALKPAEPVAKELGMELAKEGIKEGVKSSFRKGGRKPIGMPKPKGLVGQDINSIPPEAREAYKKKKGGALIKNEPSQFHSSVYPPALASYVAQMPKGKDAYGRGRAKSEAKLPKSATKRYSARGAIVAETMKKHGLSLAEASKYVKEHNLY